jgi:hypothetical protein
MDPILQKARAVTGAKPALHQCSADTTWGGMPMSGAGTTQTSRSLPDMSVHWGEAVKVTPRSKRRD